jgi:hypothetical protein
MFAVMKRKHDTLLGFQLFKLVFSRLNNERINSSRIKGVTVRWSNNVWSIPRPIVVLTGQT